MGVKRSYRFAQVVNGRMKKSENENWKNSELSDYSDYSEFSDYSDCSRALLAPKAISVNEVNF